MRAAPVDPLPPREFLLSQLAKNSRPIFKILNFRTPPEVFRNSCFDIGLEKGKLLFISFATAGKQESRDPVLPMHQADSGTHVSRGQGRDAYFGRSFRPDWFFICCALSSRGGHALRTLRAVVGPNVHTPLVHRHICSRSRARTGRPTGIRRASATLRGAASHTTFILARRHSSPTGRCTRRYTCRPPREQGTFSITPVAPRSQGNRTHTHTHTNTSATEHT